MLCPRCAGEPLNRPDEITCPLGSDLCVRTQMQIVNKYFGFSWELRKHSNGETHQLPQLDLTEKDGNSVDQHLRDEVLSVSKSCESLNEFLMLPKTGKDEGDQCLRQLPDTLDSKINKSSKDYLYNTASASQWAIWLIYADNKGTPLSTETVIAGLTAAGVSASSKLDALKKRFKFTEHPEMGEDVLSLDEVNMTCPNCDVLWENHSPSKKKCTVCARYDVIRGNSEKVKRDGSTSGLEMSLADWAEWYESQANACHYCELPEVLVKYLNLKSSVGAPISRFGVDRLGLGDSYSVDNVVMCCNSCNSMKSNRFSESETKWAIARATQSVGIVRILESITDGEFDSSLEAVLQDWVEALRRSLVADSVGQFMDMRFGDELNELSGLAHRREELLAAMNNVIHAGNAQGIDELQIQRTEVSALQADLQTVEGVLGARYKEIQDKGFDLLPKEFVKYIDPEFESVITQYEAALA